MSNQSPRRLLPATEKNSSIASQAPDQGQSSKQKVKAVSRISTACEACKRRKSRCSGPPLPCRLCRSQGTECVIDESLDQRRRASTHRLMESSSGQRELLKSLLLSLTYSPPNAVDALIASIRNNLPPFDVAAILKDNIESLDSQDEECTVPIGELQMVFSTLRMQESSALDSMYTGFSGHERVNEATEGPHTESGNVERADSSSQTKPSQRQSVADQLRLYERWIDLFGSLPNEAADNQLETSSASHSEENPKWHKGLWRQPSQKFDISDTSSPTSPADQEEISPGRRGGWHFALQIQPSKGGFQDSHADLLPAERVRLHEIASLISAQEFEGEGGWVEVLRAITQPTQEDEVGVSADKPYQYDSIRFPLHHVLPVTFYEDSPLSRVITDYRDAARTSIAQGMAPIDVLGHDGIIVELFFRERQPGDDFTVCSWAAELCRTFPDWDIYVRLAHCLMLTYLMRWLLIPTAKRYADVPDILKPLPVQRMVAHHVAIDFIPLPSLREALLKNMRDWMTTLPAAKMSVNWTNGLDEAVVPDDDLGCLRLSEAFEKHVTDLRNWSIGESILASFPELRGIVRLDQGH